MRDFKKLSVWVKAHGLTLSVYRATAGFPRSELYGLTGQIRRAAASIPANIAEGYGRSGDAELGHFLSIAMGSASELEYHLLLARDLGLLPVEHHDRVADQVFEIQRMLSSLRQKLVSRS